jgi:hypothetical protein
MRSLRVANVLPLICSRLMRLKGFIQTTHYFWCFAHCQSKPREHSPGQDAVLTAGYLDPPDQPVDRNIRVFKKCTTKHQQWNIRYHSCLPW